MKRIIIAFVMILAVATAGFSQAESDFIVELTEDGEGVVIKNYTGKLAQVKIPATIQGMPVKELGQGVFQTNGATKITSVSIPLGVTRIGSYAFYGQDKIISVVLPKSVISIGSNAFYGCSSLSSINLENVENIEDHAFSEVGLKSINLSQGLKVIEWGVFSDNKGLTTVVIPEGIVQISRHAFSGCSSLTSVVLPSTICEIDQGAFGDCINLTAITIPDTVEEIEFTDHVFSGCSKLPLAVQAALKKRGYRGSFR